VKQCRYTGPKSPPQRSREPWFEVDRSETQAVAGRRQFIRQSISVRNAQKEQQRLEDELYEEKCKEVNERLTPYIRFVEELEENKGPSQKAREFVSQDKALKKLVTESWTSPSLLFHNAVMLDLQSAENREARMKKDSEEKDRQEICARRGQFKKRLYEMLRS
jgi:hypothetical protein